MWTGAVAVSWYYPCWPQGAASLPPEYSGLKVKVLCVTISARFFICSFDILYLRQYQLKSSSNKFRISARNYDTSKMNWALV